MIKVESPQLNISSVKAMFDVQKVRNDFPILKRKLNGQTLVYLDNAATSQKPESVIKALVDYYQNYNANVHRGIHTLSEEATDAYEAVREATKDFIGASDSRSIVFTRNATEAINLVAHSWGRKNIFTGDEIVISAMEHHSNIIPWQELCAERGATLKYIELTADGLLDMDSAKSVITNKTKLVSITQMSNALGTIVPVKEIVKLAHDNGALALVDGAQGIAHLKTNVQDIDCDFLVFSFHKMLGPTGVGILYAKTNLLESMPPVLFGGDMISSVWRDKAVWNEIPWKFEAGTPNIGDVIACGEAIKYLNNLGMENIRQHEIELTVYALKRFAELPGVTVYGPSDAKLRGGVISFNFADVHPHDVGQILNESGIAIRAGHHCCQPLMRDLNVHGTARASFYFYNTKEEVDLLINALSQAHKVMGHAACR
jgi:cysteine desulfurase/selenocysteine lyase